MPKSIELALGAAILSQILLALLWAGWATGWVVAALALAALAWGLLRIAPWRWRWPVASQLLPYAPFLVLGLFYLGYALAPPTAPDAIGYHLGLVTDWMRTASLARAAPGVYDALPHGLEMLFLAAATLGGLPAASLVHYAFLLATLPLMAHVAARLGFDGRPAALLYLASPVVAAAGTSAYVDAALAFYALATFALLLDGRETAAGLTAGFCYAIKMSGGVVSIAACLFLLLGRRSWRGVAAAAAMTVPWLAAAWWLTGNPVAPMLTAWFPSPAFHEPQVAEWMEYVRSYGVPWRERAWEVTIGGARLQGLLGPAFLLAPLACAAVMGLPRFRRQMRQPWLLGVAAAVCALPWVMNAGTRFLIPAAVFAALALVCLLPPKVAWTVALLHLLVSWPPLLERYTPAGSWHLAAEWPWRAALGLEAKADYLTRIQPDINVSFMVRRHTRPGERVFDLGETPRAYAGGAVLHAAWEYAPARRVLRSLMLAHDGSRAALGDDGVKLGTLAAHWPRRRLRSLRLTLTPPGTGADPWSIQEIRLLREGQPLFPSRAWELTAQPNPWELPLAFDRNPASGWLTWTRGRAGMFVEIEGSLDCDGVALNGRLDETSPGVRVTGVDERGSEYQLSAGLVRDRPQDPARLNLRRFAIRHAAREGYRWVLANRNQADYGYLGRALADEADDWGLATVDAALGTALLEIRAMPK